jgi:hypothetical protein
MKMTREFVIDDADSSVEESAIFVSHGGDMLLPQRRMMGVTGFLCLLLAGTFAGADDTFVPKSIWGGEVRQVVEDPAHPGTYYAVSYGIYKSVDAGATWTKKPFPGTPPSVVAANAGTVQSAAHYTNAVAINRNGVIIAGDEKWSPLWRSIDGGDTWARVGPGADHYANWKNTYLVAASHYDPNVFFAALRSFDATDASMGSEDLYTSADAGLTWDRQSFFVTQDQTITGVLQLPADSAVPGRIVLGVIDQDLGKGGLPLPTTGKICYSDDNGATFAQVSTVPCYQMTWDPVHRSIWMISGQTELYTSTDAVTWTFVKKLDATLAPSQLPCGILFSSGTCPALYAFTGNEPGAFVRSRVYKSADAADGFPAVSWSRVVMPADGNGTKPFVTRQITAIVADSRDTTGDSWGVASSEGAFYYTRNGSATNPDFAEQTGIGNMPINHGIKRPGTAEIYATTAGLYRRIYRSPDNGATWALIYPRPGIYGEYANSVVLDPVNAARVYFAGNRTIKYSDSNGADNFSSTLVDFNAGSGNGLIPDPCRMSNFVINPSKPAIMYAGKMSGPATAGTPGYQLLRSTDSGASWSWIGPPDLHGIYWIGMDPQDPDTIYMGAGDRPGYGGPASTFTSDGFYRSADGGTTWAKSAYFDGCRIFNFFSDPAAPGALLVNYQPAGGDMHSAISRDGGITWNDLLTGNGGHFGGGYCFLIGSTVYGGTFLGDIYRSDDLGRTPLDLIASLPTNITWVFKGSVYVASGMGLFNISGLGGTAAVTNSYAGNDTKAYTFPNPFNPRTGRMTIRVAIPGSGAKPVKLRIYSLSGDLVYDLDAGTRAGGGSYPITWDGKNQGGDLCAPGLYFLVADVDGTIARHKIVLVY